MKKNLPIIVFEIGINHNGRVTITTNMIESFCEVVENTGYPPRLIYFKFQKRNPDIAVPEHMKALPRQSLKKDEIVTYLEYKKELEFWQVEYDFIHFFVRATDIGGWFASVWDKDSVDFMSTYKNRFIKLPSSSLSDLDLVEYAAATATKVNSTIILSTGGALETTVRDVLEILRKHGQEDPYLLSCTSTYPTPDNEVNLLKIETLKQIAPLAHVGFSSHSVSPFPAIYSNFFGVEMIEVHITLDRAMPGSDHAASLEPRGVELLLRETMRIPDLLGSGVVRPYQSELRKLQSLRK